MKNLHHHQDFFNYLDRMQSQSDEMSGDHQLFPEPTFPGRDCRVLPLTDPGFDRSPVLPPDALSKLLTFYCYSPPRSVRPSALCRALVLEAEQTLLRTASPGELLFSVLLHYLDFVYDRHKDAVIAERRSEGTDSRL